MNLEYKIRKIELSDADNFLELRRVTDGETDNMIWGKDERPKGGERNLSLLKGIIESKNQVIFVAENTETGELIGYIMASGMEAQRVRHDRSVNIAILKKYWNIGIGNKLMSELVVWAEEQKIHRLSLTVWLTNPKAEQLYEKYGFAREGVKKDAGYINGEFVDQAMMARIF